MPVKIIVKKYNVAHDELFLKGKNGLYCLLPFERLDNKKSSSSQSSSNHCYLPSPHLVIANTIFDRGTKRNTEGGPKSRTKKNK